jgi:hypothetical protein
MCFKLPSWNAWKFFVCMDYIDRAVRAPKNDRDLTAKCLACDKGGHSFDKCPMIRPLRKHPNHSAPCSRGGNKPQFTTPFHVPAASYEAVYRTGWPAKTERSQDIDLPSLPKISPNNCLLNSPLSTKRGDVPDPKWGKVSMTPAALLSMSTPDHMSPRPPVDQFLDFPTPKISTERKYWPQQGGKQESHFEEAWWNNQIGFATCTGTSYWDEDQGRRKRCYMDRTE